MLTELERRVVWEGWFSGEVRANYFADLSGHYRLRQRLSAFLTLLLSSGAFAALTAAMSLWAFVVQHQRQAIDAADLHERWARLARDYWTLWNDMYADDAAARLATLQATEEQLSKAATGFPVERRRIDKWHRYVAEHHAQRAA